MQISCVYQQTLKPSIKPIPRILNAIGNIPKPLPLIYKSFRSSASKPVEIKTSM